jgi:preprotein translocase subunit SecA
MRLFGSSSKVMDGKAGLEEAEANSALMMTKSNAHRKSRGKQLWCSCKRLLEYDDVIDAQREVIYKRRRLLPKLVLCYTG